MLPCAKSLDVLDGPEPSLVLEVLSVRLLWLSSLFCAVPTESGDCKSVLVVEVPESLGSSGSFDVPEKLSHDSVRDIV